MVMFKRMGMTQSCIQYSIMTFAGQVVREIGSERYGQGFGTRRAAENVSYSASSGRVVRNKLIRTNLGLIVGDIPEPMVIASLRPRRRHADDHRPFGDAAQLLTDDPRCSSE